MARIRVWTLTSLGKKRAKDIYSSESSNSIISYLYQNKTSTEEELSQISGKSPGETRSYLRGLEKSNLAQNLGGD